MEYPKALEDLINSFSKLPGIGRKTAERLSLFVYSNMSNDDTKEFGNRLIELKKSLKKCPICGNLTQNDICDICANQKRDKNVIMVVETVKDLFIIEKLEKYQGVYHVLNGVIDFSNGVGIEDLNIASLIERIKNNQIKEVILACNATLQGETTARYIKTLLEDIDVKVTRIAHGIPIGGDISYADEMTILKALEGRINY